MPEVKTDTPIVVPQDIAGPTSQPPKPGFSLAHISDLHLTTLQEVRFTQLLSKRILGYLSWWYKRRHVHRREIADALQADLHSTRPDHVAVTGDLTHLGLPQEFAAARQWLKALGTPEQVTVIPGNHEAYVGRGWIRSCAMWAPYLESDSRQDITKTADFFPSLRIRGPVALIGLCSARASGPFLAIGSLGRSQLDGLATLLDQTREMRLLRIVLIHHPPVTGTIKWRKRLVDNRAFLEVIDRHGADLILHGHTHYPVFSQTSSNAGSIPVIGAPSGSEWNPQAGHRASYNIYRFAPNGELALEVRTYQESLGRFVTDQETTIAPAKPDH